jgi:hypothetical protein
MFRIPTNKFDFSCRESMGFVAINSRRLAIWNLEPKFIMPSMSVSTPLTGIRRKAYAAIIAALRTVRMQKELVVTKRAVSTGCPQSLIWSLVSQRSNSKKSIAHRNMKGQLTTLHALVFLGRPRSCLPLPGGFRMFVTKTYTSSIATLIPIL